MDLGWVGVVLAVVGGAFDAVVFGEVAFDDAGVGALPSFREEDFGDLGDGVGDCFCEFMRGENLPAR